MLCKASEHRSLSRRFPTPNHRPGAEQEQGCTGDDYGRRRPRHCDVTRRSVTGVF
jgi:hypothetical protein